MLWSKVMQCIWVGSSCLNSVLVCQTMQMSDVFNHIIKHPKVIGLQFDTETPLHPSCANKPSSLCDVTSQNPLTAMTDRIIHLL